tara:strand:+ start:395 stop:1345 length:951 start_codon:yes stop_codon:yes gene_type:complete
MKINFLVPANWQNNSVFKGLAPAITLFEHSLKLNGHELFYTNKADSSKINLVLWQFVTNGYIHNVQVLNSKNSAWIQVENIDGFKQWSIQMMFDLFPKTSNENWVEGFNREYEKSKFVSWSENQNVWDYSSVNFNHFKGLPKSFHVFDWGYSEALDKRVFNEKASRGIAFYGAHSQRREDFGGQLSEMVDIDLISGRWGKELDEILSDFSVILSIGSSHPNSFKSLKFRRILESLRVAESVHKGFPVLVEKSQDPQQNDYWNEFAVVKPLLHIPHTAIALLTDDKYIEVAKEKYTSFKEKTSMARTLERLLDETFS